MDDPVLDAEAVRVDRNGQAVLDGVSLTVAPEARLLIRGASGAGKTTLFRVLGLLTTPDAGRVVIDGTSASSLPERRRAQVRRETVGLVFQEFRLVPDLTAWENARLPQTHAGRTDEAWVRELFDRLEITAQRDQYPATLSGGEKQRVAIARALANRPRVVLADEPTGQLDPTTSQRVLELLLNLQAEAGTALVVTSHDRGIGAGFQMVARLQNGRLSDVTESTETTDRAQTSPRVDDS